MRTRNLAVFLLCILTAGVTSAATFDLYNDRADFITALGAVPILEQDFEGFSDGDDMNGVEFLPGISATTNLLMIEIFESAGDNGLFILPRDQATAEYEINLTQPYLALGFDIDAFNPDTPGPGFVDVFFQDGDSALSIPLLPLNPTEPALSIVFWDWERLLRFDAK